MKRLFTLQFLVTCIYVVLLLIVCLSILYVLPGVPFLSRAISDLGDGVVTVSVIGACLVLAGFLAYIYIFSTDTIFRLERAKNQNSAYDECSQVRLKLYNAILAVQTPEAVSRIALNYLAGLASWESVAVYSYDHDEKKAFLLSFWTDADPLPDLIPVAKVIGMETLESGEIFRQRTEKDSAAGRGIFVMKIPLLNGNTLIGSIDITSNDDGEIDRHIPVVKEMVGPLTIAIQNSRLFSEVEKQQHQLRSLSARLTEMEEAERKNIAIELHDRVGQNLSALNINLNIIKSRMKGGLIDGAEVCIADSFMLIEETTEQIRDIMSDLRPPNLDDHGLLAAIRWYANQRTKRTGLEIEVIGDGSAPRLLPEIEMVFFRIAQESLNNIIKHAKAHSAKVSVSIQDGRIRMVISDDGIGFDTQKNIDHSRREHSGLGLIAMQERIAALGGSFLVESAKGKGSKVTVEV